MSGAWLNKSKIRCGGCITILPQMLTYRLHGSMGHVYNSPALSSCRPSSLNAAKHGAAYRSRQEIIQVQWSPEFGPTQNLNLDPNRLIKIYTNIKKDLVNFISDRISQNFDQTVRIQSQILSY